MINKNIPVIPEQIVNSLERGRKTHLKGKVGKSIDDVFDELAGKVGESAFMVEYVPVKGFPFVNCTFFDGLVSINHEYDHIDFGEGMLWSNSITWKPKTKKSISLDFMGTMNDPKAKTKIWDAIQTAILRDDTEALNASGITYEQLKHFKQYIKDEQCDPMQFRDYALAQDGIKKTIGMYSSIGAEAGQLNDCQVHQDAVDFLVVNAALGHPVDIFSTIGAPEGYRNLSEIMLSNHNLSEDRQTFLKCWGVEATNAAGLIRDYLVSKKKKSAPGEAVLEETAAKGLHLYVDDDLGIINPVIEAFGAQNQTTLPILARIEKPGVKDSGYQAPQEHPGIEKVVTATSLMDKTLLEAIYLP
jgi:hypothetical protein